MTPTTTGRIDSVGTALAVLFLASLTYGLIEAPDERVVEPGSRSPAWWSPP